MKKLNSKLIMNLTTSLNELLYVSALAEVTVYLKALWFASTFDQLLMQEEVCQKEFFLMTNDLILLI